MFFDDGLVDSHVIGRVYPKRSLDLLRGYVLQKAARTAQLQALSVRLFNDPSDLHFH